jgi:putative lipase involved disintegration of autophagic bodies
MEEEKKQMSAAEAKAQNERIFAEVQAQMAYDKQSSDDYFVRSERQMKENKSILKALNAIDKKNNAMWEQCGIKLDEVDGKNPVLSLEKIAPDAFKGMTEWVEKSRRAAIKEIEDMGFDYAAIRKSAAERRSSIPTPIFASATSANGESTDAPERRAKKSVRRVRL